MVTLATVPFDQFRPSTIEVDALEKRYSVQTLERMREIYPSAEMLFVVGTDMYKDIHTWKDHRRLFELAHIVVVNRPGFRMREDLAPFQTIHAGTPVHLPKKNSIFFLPFVEQPISSTEIRGAIGSARQWLPPQVWSYIEKNNLYS